jgi:hypothetical protein
MSKKNITPDKSQNIVIRKFDVCNHCYSVSLTDPNCICSYGNYKTITLEFEVCACCGHLIHDGCPANTPFNDEQLNLLKKTVSL